jgi:tetratricopeptide (TPR) repeat protein
VTRAEALFHALFALFVIAIGTTRVRADELNDFEAARTRYDRHEYARAADSFRTLVGTDPPRISNALLVLESRKYYGASLLFLGKKEEARAQFRRLLEQEPDYALDPLAFPTEVVATFDEVKASVRGDLERKRAQEAAIRAEIERAAQAAEELRLENLVRLRTLAEQEIEVTRNSRWIATVPFGVGQFQNGHKGLGVALAVAQGFAAATSVITFIGYQQVADDKPTFSELDETNRIKRSWYTANVASFTTFAVLALAGIIDAHMRFVPGRVRATPRSLPPDLDRWVREQGRAMAPVLRF